MAATAKELGDLHALQTRALTKLLARMNTAIDAMGRLPEDLSPGDRAALLDAMSGIVNPAILTAANQFLKNNNITGANDDLDGLGAEAEALKSKRRRFSDLMNGTGKDGVQ